MPPADEPPSIAPSGDLATTPPEALLRDCERVHFTGTLAFDAESTHGVLPMLNGVAEIGADDPRIEQALDDFLAARTGRYTLTQMLPPLEGATHNGELGLHGSL